MNTCAFLMISTCLMAAPIPKSDPEGTVLLVRTSPVPMELVLMKSGGTVIKRFEPNGIEGHITYVRLVASNSKALVLAQKTRTAGVALQGNGNIPRYSAYLIDLEKHEEPAKVVIDDVIGMSRFTVIPRDKKIVFSDLDEKEAAATKQDDELPYRSWTINWETGKKEPLKLPKGHLVADISADEKSLISTRQVLVKRVEDYAKTRTYVSSLDPKESQKEPTLAVEGEFKGTQISPDGKWILGSKLTKDENSPSQRFMYYSLNIKTQTLQKIRLPEKAYMMIGSPVWTHQGNKIAYIWYEQFMDPSLNGQISIRYNLGLSNVTGDSQKLILQNPPREYFTVFDWR
ncbi:MAG: hypothetical protein U0798_00895 [Gemmataceae bacterium]